MTNKQYLIALNKLGLTPHSKRTAEVLDLSLRQCQRIAEGTAKVPKHVALLLAAFLRDGLPAKPANHQP